MAVVTPVSSTMRLGFQTGIDGDGNPIQKARSFNRLKTNAVEQDVFDVAQALAGLQDLPLVSIRRVDTSDITM